MFDSWIKNFKITFNDRSSFSSGDVFTGNISFDLTKETKINSISMKLKGLVNVHWSSGSRKHRRHYSSTVNFFELKSVVVGENVGTREPVRLRPGTHVYPYTCQIPHGNFPSSFHGPHGKTEYTLTVAISRPWHLSKDFVTLLNFVHHIDTNIPELRAPLSGTNTMTLCCFWYASGPAIMTASTEKKAFMPGETIKIICNFTNGSSRTATPKLKLQQKQSYFAVKGTDKRLYITTVATLNGQPVSARASNQHVEFMLTIPPSTSLSISNCNYLVIEYIVSVSLGISAHPDLTVLIPIIICSTPVNADPPHYS